MKQVRFKTKAATCLALLILTLMAGASCVRKPRSNTAHATVHSAEAPFHVNINTAPATELENLPGVGKVIAERIVTYREQYGRFRRPEELLMVNGVSDKKFRAIQAMIVVE
jgi:competence ComEA-like helix-hairpin-helix protein